MTLSYVAQWEKLFVNARRLSGRSYSVEILDIGGQLLYAARKKPVSGYLTDEIQMTGYASGVYLVRLRSDRESVQGKFVKY